MDNEVEFRVAAKLENLAVLRTLIAAVGTFAVLGSVFGILTVFQLLELANPSQPLLRRLLVETPGTYHHSLMVGNLAERAAESIGADPSVLTSLPPDVHAVIRTRAPRDAAIIAAPFDARPFPPRTDRPHL